MSWSQVRLLFDLKMIPDQDLPRGSAGQAHRTMKIDPRLSRLARLLAATSLTIGGNGLAPPAMAQGSADPPWRVGRLAQAIGSVSTHGAGATGWTAATPNVPLSSGDAIWTQPSSGAVIQVSDNRIALGEATEFDLATLDNHQLIATEPQGEVFLDLRDVPPGDGYAITTPRGVVQLGGAGQYEIAAGDSNSPTTIGVVAGSARIVSGSFSLQISAGQRGTVTGTDALLGAVGPLVRDAFLSAQLAELAPPPAGPPSVRYMTGCESLGSYGSWQPSPQYGQVWYPRVSSGWAPYRDGSWSYIAPWGWTWVDDEPWGFAPFHYGRWAQLDGRWGWIPADQQEPAEIYQQPAYAPALVDFVVAGAAAGIVVGALASGFGGHGPVRGGGDVGWIPLGPHEAYAPPFGASRGYVQRINYGRIDSHDTTIINDLANRGALTVVPAAAMARSRPVAAIARTGPAALGQGGQPSPFQVARDGLPVRPAADTRGVTPVVAQRFGFHPVAAQAAPGPAVDQALFRPQALPASRAPFRGVAATGPAAARIGVPVMGPGGPHGPAAPGPAIAPARPNGLPALRTPGAVPPGIEAARPAGGHPDAVQPQAARPEFGHPGVRPPPAARPEIGTRPAAAPAAQPGRPAGPHREVPAPRHETPRPAPPEATQHREPVRQHQPVQHAMPPREAPRPAARPEPSRPALRETARPPAPAHPQAGPRRDDHRPRH